MWNAFVICVFLLLSVQQIFSFNCTNNGDCQVVNAVCVNQTCTCPAEYVTNSIATECIPIANGFGGNCTDNLQCSAKLLSGGFCNNGSCDCEPGYHYFLGNCWKTAGLFEKCYADQNCFVDHDFESSICNNQKICVCREGFYQREYSSCRRKSSKPGDPCGITMDCQFPNAVCLWNHTCAITNSSHQFLDTFSKLKETISRNVSVTLSNYATAKIGAECDSSSGCPTNSECTDGVCECFLGFYTLDQTACYPEVGAQCSVDTDCIGRNTFCRNKNHCSCTEGHVISSDRRSCDKLSRFIGWSCLRDAWCAYFGPGSICLDKSCACSNTTRYIPDQMYCWVAKRAGESCQNDLDCGMDGMSCKQGKCQCQTGSHASSNGTECRPDAHTPGDNCVENIDCMFPHSKCDKTTSKCACAAKYALNNTICVPGIGGPCNGTSSCILEHSTCVNATCSCNSNFVPSTIGEVCLPVQTVIGGPCQDDNQCAQKFDGICSRGTCQCPPNHHYVNGSRCFKSVELGGACTMDGQCVENAFCLKYICTCNHGYNTNGNVCSGAAPNFTNRLSLMVVILIAIFK